MAEEESAVAGEVRNAAFETVSVALLQVIWELRKIATRADRSVMHLLNEVALETPKGFRTIELYEGDLMRLGRPVDILVLSAYANSYYPVRGSVIASLLEAFSLDASKLLEVAQLDLRSSLGIWISNPLKGVPFTRIIAVELRAGAVDIGEALDNVFAGVGLLEAKGVTVRTIALPLLGSGSQRLTPEMILPYLIPSVSRALNRLDGIERVYFVERDAERARALSDAIDQSLQRSTERLGTDEAHDSVRREFVNSLQRHGHLVPKGHEFLPVELREGLERSAPRAIEMGILGRRLVEFVVDSMSDAAPGNRSLDQRIEGLAGAGVAPWIRSYMHVLRVFGNEQAHQKDSTNRHPPFVVSQDLTVCLFCMLRVWEYWVATKGQSHLAPSPRDTRASP